MKKTDLKKRILAGLAAVSIVCAMSAVFTGCGSSRQAASREPYIPITADENSAVLHFYRNSFYGAAIRYSVHIDDSLVWKCRNKAKASVRVTGEGTRLLWAATEGREEDTVEIEHGQEYYIRCGVRMGAFVGRPSMTVVDSATGKAEFDKIQ
jgi:hypothetical protein